MMVSATQVGNQPVALTVNPPTEQVARDNQVREKIVPPSEIAHAAKEKAVSREEKQLRKPSWDPSEHPDYTEEQPAYTQYQEHIASLVEALSADRYLPKEQDLGYSMHIELPRELLEELEKISISERTKGVVSHHYAMATLPNPPTEVLVVL